MGTPITSQIIMLPPAHGPQASQLGMGRHHRAQVGRRRRRRMKQEKRRKWRRRRQG